MIIANQSQKVTQIKQKARFANGQKQVTSEIDRGFGPSELTVSGENSVISPKTNQVPRTF